MSENIEQPLPRTFEEFNEQRKAAFIRVKDYKQAGNRLVGFLCSYTPLEIIDAAGAASVALCGTSDEVIPEAEKVLPANLCPLIKSTYGFAYSQKCPFTYFSDMIIGETTCDGKKKMYELLNELKRTHILYLPQGRDRAYEREGWYEECRLLKEELENFYGITITDDDLRAAIKVMNRSRAARRAFVKLASEHCDVISAVSRSAVLRSAWFMEPAVYAEKLEALNAELAQLPAANWKGRKIVTSGIICDNPKLLQIFDDNNIAIAADDVAQETRAFRVDASEEGDPMMALAQQFADQDYDVLLYDEHSNKNRRADYVVQMVKESGAQGLVLFMQQFCDPEEMEYPYLKKALDEAGVPHIKLGVDQQMRDFGQASTAIQAFADVL